MKMLQAVHYGVVELGRNVKVSDPCYGSSVWCSKVLHNVSEGHYDCYILTSDENTWGNRVAFMVLCKDGHQFDIPSTYIPCDIGVDAGVCGIYDLDYYNKYHSDNAVDENWYQENVVSWCGSDKAQICEEGKGFITCSGFGDGGYALFVDKDEHGNVVRIAVDYFVIEPDDDYELIFVEQ